MHSKGAQRIVYYCLERKKEARKEIAGCVGVRLFLGLGTAKVFCWD
jgi:hypothetical protein